MQAQLCCLSGAYAGQNFPLSTEQIIIGRNPSIANIVLPANDLEFSGKHAAVWFDPQQKVCYVEDYSTCGTFRATGEKISKGIPIAIQSGERFYLSSSNCTFEFRLVEVEPPIIDGGGQPTADYVYVPGVYAGFWRRYAAYLFDWTALSIIIWVFDLLLIIPMMGLSLVNVGRPDISWYSTFVWYLGSFMWVGIFSVLVTWLYFALMESSAHQATLGKMAVGVRVTDLYGNRISFSRATGRFFGKIISGLILGVGYIMAGFTTNKQGLHDMLAGCLVEKEWYRPKAK